ncbi:hypothetical protein TGAM01_v205858 [Trichoderma gamsii]|uniref:Uncharacterized protein n=1 Tax=Trichoderma gamsii TaxID=398673 RepID=A0A2P4ZLK5_9HYPO|nr:hypothetical protein TGAM01_v205858 [Trichoderma gamsii]PON25172.1 hypothetical protein TGAM01_v205858 [Trichoderma gamsii]
MSSSSTRATYGGSNAQQTGVNSEKAQISPQVPVHLTYDMDRFAQKSGKKSSSGHLRPPLEFRSAPTQAESEARMQAQLHEFDDKFYKSNGSSDKCTPSAKK